jgi:hypothetical protein
VQNYEHRKNTVRNDLALKIELILEIYWTKFSHYCHQVGTALAMNEHSVGECTRSDGHHACDPVQNNKGGTSGQLICY